MLTKKPRGTVGTGKVAMQGRQAESRCATKLTNLFNGGLKVREWHGSWPAGPNQLQHVGIGHFLDATEVGHNHGNRPAHPGATADHDPMVSHMLFDPTDCIGQSFPVRLSEFFKRNPSVDQPMRYFIVEFLGHQ